MDEKEIENRDKAVPMNKKKARVGEKDRSNHHLQAIFPERKDEVKFIAQEFLREYLWEIEISPRGIYPRL